MSECDRMHLSDGWIAFVILSSIGIAFIFFVWLFIFFPAIYKAKLYNQKFNTHYSTLDFAFAEDTILSYINQGEQKTDNIEINKPIELKFIK